MNSKIFSDAMSELDNKYVDEAINYKKKAKKAGTIKWGAMAACLAVLVVACGIFFHSNSGMVVKVYAHGTDEEITEAGAVINTGTISDTGEMQGHPLMFYLSGEDIETVRFSCKNHQINFMDWTEKRDEYGNAQNFTVTYGEDESEYYYLTIDWIPNTIIRELTDNAETTVATLPAELREDIIVMEITFANGKTATKAITISLMEDGTFFAAYDNYKINETDDFIKRVDSVPISRSILYAQGDNPKNGETPGSGEPVRGGATDDMPQVGNSISGDVETTQPAIVTTTNAADASPMVYVNGTLYKQNTEQISYGEMKEEFIYLGKIESNVTNNQSSTDGIPKENFQANIPIVGAEVYQYGDDVVIHTDNKYWLYEAVNNENISGTQEELSDEEKMLLDPSYAANADATESAAEEAARAYYADTVFEIVSLELERQTENEIIFSVSVSKGGVVQEPNRTITLQRDNETWKVINEGY